MIKGLLLRYLLLALLSVPLQMTSQTLYKSTDMVEGLRKKAVPYFALRNVTLIPAPGQRLNNATVIVRGDRIESITSSASLPEGCTAVDASGLWVYAGLVEAYANVGFPSAKPSRDDDEGPGAPLPASRGARYWNEAVKPEFSAIESVSLDEKTAAEFRKIGFGIIHTNRPDGIVRGTGAVVHALAGSASEIVAKPDASLWVSFRKGTSRQAYPTSQMGSIALIRQAISDAQWYQKARREAGPKAPDYNLSLERLSELLQRKTPVFFESENEHALLRAHRLCQEFRIQPILEGSGREYRRLADIKATGASLIVPINLPDAPDVSSIDNALDVSLEELMHWDAAPKNLAWLDSAGVEFAVTSHQLKDRSAFWKNLRKAVSYGLSRDRALAALTTVPAKLIGMTDLCGQVKPGAFSHLVITDGDIFDEGTSIMSTYVAGQEHVIQPRMPQDIRGKWRLSVAGLPQMTLAVDGTRNAPKASAKLGEKSIDVSLSASIYGRALLSLTVDTMGMQGKVRLEGAIDSLRAAGGGTTPNGTATTWEARRDSSFVAKADTNKPVVKSPEIGLLFPHGPYGRVAPPEQRSVLFRNATVWTCGKNGVLENTDVLISNGKITAIGKGLGASADTVIDAIGRHITPGIIDEHSHIAIEGGVNEGSHAVTSEVRIGDVLAPDDINIYRQLAGGVTSSHLLHGSANPIGGQLQLIRMKWGEGAEGLKWRNLPGTIKFALGENVKQSNWGDRFTSRYPQSRMGVEEIMRDRFQSALEYERRKTSPLAGEPPVRPDYQLDALLEIVRGQRLIHCHSYVQSEILMLIRLAEEFKFKVNTFTHILEGYKVAKEMSEHGSAGSSFADWWAYKMEVMDAIPQNPAIMHEQGVLVAINSDDAEMARRLNQESAKSVKYGGVSEEDALKFATLNPAKLLKIDDRVGSIEPGKEADLVIWSGNPLSSFSKVERTYVEGRCYFDIESDKAMRQRDRAIRSLLEQKAMGSGSESGAAPKGRKIRHLHDCEDVEDHTSGAEE